MIYGLLTSAPEVPVLDGLVVLGFESVVVYIKAAVETPHRIEHKGAHKSRRGVTVCPESLRQSRHPRGQAAIHPAAEAIPHGIRPGENGGVRRPCQRDLRDGLREQNSIARQRIHGWSLDGGVPVATQMVCTQRVHSYEDHVEVGRLRAARGTRSEATDRTDREQQNNMPIQRGQRVKTGFFWQVVPMPHCDGAPSRGTFPRIPCNARDSRTGLCSLV